MHRVWARTWDAQHEGSQEASFRLMSTAVAPSTTLYFVRSTRSGKAKRGAARMVKLVHLSRCIFAYPLPRCYPAINPHLPLDHVCAMMAEIRRPREADETQASVPCLQPRPPTMLRK